MLALGMLDLEAIEEEIGFKKNENNKKITPEFNVSY